ncbi:MAG TPA: TIGR03084 family metal-binding protein [Acidimicrobiales bacterium]|nr:TIGR03084 family metal-binding protein [Acidimicrobiales bacterium]
MSPLSDLCADLAAEAEALDALVADADVRTPTPAPGWDVGDQLSHLAFFDEAAALALSDPERFVTTRPATAAELAALIDAATDAGRARTEAELLAWWRDAWRAFVVAAVTAEVDTRVPWYGPSMSVLSFVTARLMETWAHGQDIADGLGIARPATPRLRHVAQLGVLAFGNSFRAHRLDVPHVAVHVELACGDETWTWGDAWAADRVRGDAFDFCLVVTQRRHLDDTGLHVDGPVARQWMSIAQAFAGPPGPGRVPGQFKEEPCPHT